MPRSPGERSDTQAKLARIRETLARLRAAPDRDEARIGALEMRVLELRRRLQEAEPGLRPLREDGCYGSGL